MAIGACVYDIRDIDVLSLTVDRWTEDAIYDTSFWWRGVHRVIMGIFYATYAQTVMAVQSDDFVCGSQLSRSAQ